MTETTMHAAITTPASRIPLSCRTFFLMILGGCIIAALIVAYSLLLDRSGRAAENNEDVLQSAQHFRRKDLDVAAPRYTPTSLDRLVKLKHAAENIQQMQHRGVLTPQSQLLYVVQWLGEFSEIEKDDFLQELLELYAPGQLPVGQVLKRAKFEDRPPSLFQCRMDLLKEWYESWSSEGEKEELLFRISEADSEFFERFDKSRLLPNEEKVVEEFWIRNGSCNGKVDDIASYNGHAAPDSEKKPVEEDNFEQQPMIYAPATYRLEHDQLSNSTSGSCLSNDLQAKLENCSNLFTENTSNEPEVNNASVKEETRESDVEKSLLIPLDIPEWKQSELSQEQNEQIKEAPSKPDSAQDLSTVGGVSVEAAIAEQDGVVVASSQNGSTEPLELQ